MDYLPNQSPLSKSQEVTTIPLLGTFANEILRINPILAQASGPKIFIPEQKRSLQIFLDHLEKYSIKGDNLGSIQCTTGRFWMK